MPYDGVDEFTPRERGLMIGYEFASTWPGHSPDDREMLVRMADGEMPADVWEEMLDGGMRERLDASVDPDAEEAFKGGFADGPATLASYNRAYRARIELLFSRAPDPRRAHRSRVRAGRSVGRVGMGTAPTGRIVSVGLGPIWARARTSNSAGGGSTPAGAMAQPSKILVMKTLFGSAS